MEEIQRARTISLSLLYRTVKQITTVPRDCDNDDPNVRPTFEASRFRVTATSWLSAEAKLFCRDILKKPTERRNREDLKLIVQVATANDQLFGGLPHSVKLQVARKMTHRRVERNELVFRQGDEPLHFYTILFGSAWVCVERGEEFDGNQDQTNVDAEYTRIGDVVAKRVAVLYAGDSFGELGLVNNEPRSATILAREALDLIEVSKEDYHAAYSQFKEDQLIQKTTFFQEIPMFWPFPQKLIQVFAYVSSIETFDRSKVIVSQGVKAEKVFFVLKGEVELLREIKTVPPEIAKRMDPPSNGCMVVSVRNLGPYEHFSMYETLTQGKETVTVRAATQVECITLKRSAITKRIDDDMLELLKEYSMLDIPSDKELLDQFRDTSEWSQFKGVILNEALADLNKKKRQRQTKKILKLVDDVANAYARAQEPQPHMASRLKYLMRDKTPKYRPFVPSVDSVQPDPSLPPLTSLSLPEEGQPPTPPFDASNAEELRRIQNQGQLDSVMSGLPGDKVKVQFSHWQKLRWMRMVVAKEHSPDTPPAERGSSIDDFPPYRPGLRAAMASPNPYVLPGFTQRASKRRAPDPGGPARERPHTRSDEQTYDDTYFSERRMAALKRAEEEKALQRLCEKQTRAKTLQLAQSRPAILVDPAGGTAAGVGVEGGASPSGAVAVGTPSPTTQPPLLTVEGGSDGGGGTPAHTPTINLSGAGPPGEGVSDSLVVLGSEAAGRAPTATASPSDAGPQPSQKSSQQRARFLTRLVEKGKLSPSSPNLGSPAGPTGGGPEGPAGGTMLGGRIRSTSYNPPSGADRHRSDSNLSAKVRSGTGDSGGGRGESGGSKRGRRSQRLGVPSIIVSDNDEHGEDSICNGETSPSGKRKTLIGRSASYHVGSVSPGDARSRFVRALGKAGKSMSHLERRQTPGSSRRSEGEGEDEDPLPPPITSHEEKMRVQLEREAACGAPVVELSEDEQYVMLGKNRVHLSTSVGCLKRWNRDKQARSRSAYLLSKRPQMPSLRALTATLDPLTVQDSDLAATTDPSLDS